MAPSTLPASFSFAELLALPEVKEEVELRSRFGFTAYHGGNLERRTELIASEAAKRAGASYYGVVQPIDMHHHISSIKIDPAVSDRFASFIDHCDVVVTVHGYGRRGMYTSLLCGGANRVLAAHVASCLRDALPAYRTIDQIDDIPKKLRGLHPKNPCNLTTGGGMQLELPPRVRGLTPLVNHWPATSSLPQQSEMPTTFTHLHQLIEGLATAARSWNA